MKIELIVIAVMSVIIIILLLELLLPSKPELIQTGSYTRVGYEETEYPLQFVVTYMYKYVHYEARFVEEWRYKAMLKYLRREK